MKLALLYTALFMIGGYSLAWIQQAGQAAWIWAKPPWPAIIFGIPTSILFSYAAKYSFEYTSEAWFFKIAAHFMGTLVFAVLTYLILGQGLDWKLGLSIFLCFVAVLIQL